MTIPDRLEYLQEQKTQGRKLLGVFPAYYPREILWAFDILPAEIWDPPSSSSRSNAHLQPYVCSIVHQGLELILEGHTEILDGYLFPHTCDSLQNLASIVNDHLEQDKPCLFFYHPKSAQKNTAAAFYREQLNYLISQLEEYFGTFDKKRLQEMMEISLNLNKLLEQLFRKRASGELTLSNSEFYRTLRLGEFLWPTDYIYFLNNLLERADIDEPGTRGIVLSGVLPNPPEILTLLDFHGVRVTNDDFLNSQRRLQFMPGNSNEPVEDLAEGYFNQPPCSTKGGPIIDRVNHLSSLVKDSGAKGIIFNMTKFCEPELFDIPQLRSELLKLDIPSLVIETEINQNLSGQLQTRLEAFLEMVEN